VKPIEPITCPAVTVGPCPGEGVQALQVLRATNGEPWGELEDRDTFDWPGAGVTMGSPEHPSFSERKYLEVFDVEVNTSYGPFRDCNYNKALKKAVCSPPYSPDLARLVARSSAEQLQAAPKAGPMGQCGQNDIVGSWYVFPHEGRCGQDQQVGDGGCTWKLKSAKVVEMSCGSPKKWASAWTADFQKGPFLEVQNVLKAAVQDCPDIRENRLI